MIPTKTERNTDMNTIEEAKNEAVKLLRQILNCHESGNNGAYMGEAVLCPYFATAANDILSRAEAK